jgi:hypothetical protein
MKTKDVPSSRFQPKKPPSAPSVGSEKEEILELDSGNQLLEALYEGLKRKLINLADPEKLINVVDPEIIFSNVIRLTRCCFPNANPDEFIQRELKKEKPNICLSQFILEEQGHSRHHALLNAYFLSRLVKDELLFGTVICCRKKLQAEFHTWNLFQDTKGRVYSIDSLKNEMFCINSQPGKLTGLYSQSVETEIIQTFRIKKDPVDPIVNNQPKRLPSLYSQCTETKINKTSGKKKALADPIVNSQPKGLPSLYSQRTETKINKTSGKKKALADPIVNNQPKGLSSLYSQRTETKINETFGNKDNKVLINYVKEKIEKITFPVDSCCFWEGGLPLKLLGRERRVPHRLYEIYIKISTNKSYSDDPEAARQLLQSIQKSAQDALDNPRAGRNGRTTRFYEEITKLDSRSERLQKAREQRSHLYT